MILRHPRWRRRRQKAPEQPEYLKGPDGRLYESVLFPSHWGLGPGFAHLLPLEEEAEDSGEEDLVR